MYKKQKKFEPVVEHDGTIQEVITLSPHEEVFEEKYDPVAAKEKYYDAKKRYQKYMPSSYPWKSIEKYFVQGAPDKKGEMHYPTLHEITQHFGVSFTSARRRMIEEGWMQKREQWQFALHQKIQQESLLDYLEAAQKFDATCVESAQRALDEVLGFFLEAKATETQLTQLDLDRLGRAAVNWQRVGRLALGLSTENTAARFETKSGDTLSSIDLTHLTEEELSQMKILLQQAEIRASKTVDAEIATQNTEGSLV